MKRLLPLLLLLPLAAPAVARADNMEKYLELLRSDLRTSKTQLQTEALQLSEENARQLASRARKFLGGERRRAVSAEDHRRLLDAFLAAARAGDRPGLEQHLASDVVGYSACASHSPGRSLAHRG